jgi:hypothetical protein
LEFGITNRNRAPGSVKFDFHSCDFFVDEAQNRRVSLPEPPVSFTLVR